MSIANKWNASVENISLAYMQMSRFFSYGAFCHISHICKLVKPMLPETIMSFGNTQSNSAGYMPLFLLSWLLTEGMATLLTS